jgi:hypothetical protein
MTTHKTRTTDSKRTSRAVKTKTAARDKRAADDLEQTRQVLAKVAYGHELTATDKRRLRKIGAGFGLDAAVTGWEKGKATQVASLGLPGVTETHYLKENGVIITELHGLPPLDLTGREGEFTEVTPISRAEYEAFLARAKMLRDFVPPATGDRPQLKKMPAGTPVTVIPSKIADATKGNIPLESTSPDCASVEVGQFIPLESEGLLNKALATVLRDWGVPESDFVATAAELERVAKARASAARRPKWDERGKYAELKDLSAPQFLKRVYADVITPDGSIEKQMVRDIDPKLMASVEVYLSNRKSRQKDLGDADGLRLIAGPTSPLRRSVLG